MAEAERRIAEGDASRKFANLSFDDGYRDTLEVALPVFAAKRVPMTVYLTTGFLDGEHIAWWDALEHLLRARGRIVVPWRDGTQRLESALSRLGHQDIGELSEEQDAASVATDLYQDELDAGLADDLREDLAAIDRAEARLAAGTYGLSIESGEPISDERLEALPAAERTAEEERRS